MYFFPNDFEMNDKFFLDRYTLRWRFAREGSYVKVCQRHQMETQGKQTLIGHINPELLTFDFTSGATNKTLLPTSTYGLLITSTMDELFVNQIQSL